MNQYRLHQKRHRRQLKRKVARASAKRRTISQSAEHQHAPGMMKKAQAEAQKPGLMGRLFGGGTQIGHDQPDAQAAPIEGASAS